MDPYPAGLMDPDVRVPPALTRLRRAVLKYKRFDEAVGSESLFSQCLACIKHPLRWWRGAS